MKKIINGKVYNTETAELIGEYSNGLGSRDFRHVAESLHKTQKGAYFLAGEGGALSKYAESCGNNSWSGGSNIEPMTRKQAMEWAQEHLSPAETEAEFSDMLEEA